MRASLVAGGCIWWARAALELAFAPEYWSPRTLVDHEASPSASPSWHSPWRARTGAGEGPANGRLRLESPANLSARSADDPFVGDGVRIRLGDDDEYARPVAHAQGTSQHRGVGDRQ